MHEVPAGAVDAHAHVFVRHLPTAEQPRYVPGYDATPEAYLRMLDAHGITGAVLVQPSFLGCHNEFLLDCLSRHPGRFRGILVLGTRQPADWHLLAAGGVVGIRLNLIGREVPDLRTPGWRRLAAELAARGQHLEVQAYGTQWTELAPALHHWPSRVVLDHLGLPSNPSANREVLDLARREHVWVKISAPYRSPGDAADHMLEQLLRHSGTTRLLWGSDWPWTRHEDHRGYHHCLQWLRTRVSTQVFQAILRHNPSRLLNWSPTATSANSTTPQGPAH